ncbi:MAG: T9SS type A sorting domain-containing protein, partial [Chitinophagaceae bacterium]
KGSGNVFFNVNDGDFAIEFSNVGVKSVSALDAVSISPIPTKQNLKISVPESLGKVQVDIRNMLAQSLYSKVIQGNASIQVQDWPRGFYQVILKKDSEASVSKKIILE